MVGSIPEAVFGAVFTQGVGLSTEGLAAPGAATNLATECGFGALLAAHPKGAEAAAGRAIHLMVAGSAVGRGIDFGFADDALAPEAGASIGGISRGAACPRPAGTGAELLKGVADGKSQATAGTDSAADHRGVFAPPESGLPAAG
jgi:hypothetical protein